MTKDMLAKEIQSAVKWLIEEDCGCSTIKLDDRLAVCVGWQDGYRGNEKFVIHSVKDPTWGLVAGIKVWTSDSIRTDFGWINSPYYKNGDVWNDDITIYIDQNYELLAKWFLKEYQTLSAFEIDKDGMIINEGDNE